MLNYFFVLLLSAQPVPTPEISQGIKASSPKVQFEILFAYTRSEKYEPLNEYISKELYKEFASLSSQGMSNQELKDLVLFKDLTKVEYLDELTKGNASCLFYNVQFSDNAEFFAGQSGPVIMGMVLEGGEWKYDTLLILTKGQPLLEFCNKYILDPNQ